MLMGAEEIRFREQGTFHYSTIFQPAKSILDGGGLDRVFRVYNQYRPLQVETTLVWLRVTSIYLMIHNVAHSVSTCKARRGHVMDTLTVTSCRAATESVNVTGLLSRVGANESASQGLVLCSG